MSGKNQNFRDNNQKNGQKQTRENGADSVQEAQKLYSDLRRKKVPVALAAVICAAVLGFGAWSGMHFGNQSSQSGENRITQTTQPRETEQAEDSQETEKPEETREQTDAQEIRYGFRTDRQLEDHFERHGVEMGFEDEDAYVAGANRVIASPDALHKLEAEDGDDVYYLEETNEFVVVSKDGYIRTYFEPDDGIDYYERQ